VTARLLWLSIVAVGLTACAEDVERGPAERRNLAALDAIPTPEGSVAVRTETLGRHAADTSDGPIVGWDTIRELRVTGQERGAEVVVRARTDLERGGWQITTEDDFYLNARRDHSCLHLLTSSSAPSVSDEFEESTATDTAPPDSEVAPGAGPAHGLTLKVSDC
jgi:hypothetical protein